MTTPSPLDAACMAAIATSDALYDLLDGGDGEPYSYITRAEAAVLHDVMHTLANHALSRTITLTELEVGRAFLTGLRRTITRRQHTPQWDRPTWAQVAEYQAAKDLAQ